jgi:2-polyprenyl-3-methyl-5-hydroxy-6-metoxy-1,4-benzoquinol methylase
VSATELTPDYLQTKNTTQKAILEKPLSWMRCLKGRKYCSGKRVLDFGCGAGLTNLRALQGVAAERAGLDQLFFGTPPCKNPDGIYIYGSYEDLPQTSFDVITALAVFEHIEPIELPIVLNNLKRSLKKDGLIVGTVPTPRGQPVLEFLSYKLGIIDESQIRDHKKYYSRNELAEQFASAGLAMIDYQTFQLGMNSFFVASVQN